MNPDVVFALAGITFLIGAVVGITVSALYHAFRGDL